MRNLYNYLWMMLLALSTACSQQSKKPDKAAPVVRIKAYPIPIKPDSVKKVTIREPDLKAWVEELNVRLALYDSLRAFSEYTKEDLIKLKLPSEDADSLINLKGDSEKFVRGADAAIVYQITIDKLLQRILTHPQIRNYSLGDILGMIPMLISDDGKVTNLILPENTGGSYQNRLSWIHYRSDDGQIYNYYPEQLIAEGDSLHTNGGFNSDGFDTILPVSTKTGVKYLMQGEVISCNTCIAYYIQLAHFDKGKAVIDFSYTLNTRNTFQDAPAITYDANKRIIIATNKPYTADLAACDCKTDDQREYDIQHIQYSEDGTPKSSDEGIKYSKALKCIFRFNGDTFVLDKKRSRLPRK